MLSCDLCHKNKRAACFKKHINANEPLLCNYCRNKCEHGTQRSRCKQCKGMEICPHEKRKSHCKKCKGNRFCQAHGKRKSLCVACNNTSQCSHGHQKTNCYECSLNIIRAALPDYEFVPHDDDDKIKSGVQEEECVRLLKSTKTASDKSAANIGQQQAIQSAFDTKEN